MSASEKLRALDAVDELRHMCVSVDGQERDVTERIMAVVEAAEAHRKIPKAYTGGGGRDPYGFEKRIAAALAALDKALSPPTGERKDAA